MSKIFTTNWNNFSWKKSKTSKEIQENETVFYLFSLTFDDEILALKVADNIREGTLTFAEAVEQYGTRLEKSCGGFLGEFLRSDLPGQYQTSINGDVIDNTNLEYGI